MDTFRVSVLSFPHHLVISCGGGGSVLIVLGRLLVLPRCSLFSSDAAIVRRTAGVSHPSFVSFSYELGKTAHDWISRSSLSDVHPGFSFLTHYVRLVRRLVGASRAVSSSWCSLVAMGVSCGSARWRLVVVPGRHSFILRRGGVLALILRLSSRLLLVSPSRVASRLLVLPCPAGSGSVACLLVPSCLFFSCGVVCRCSGASYRACSSRLIALLVSSAVAFVLVSSLVSFLISGGVSWACRHR